MNPNPAPVILVVDDEPKAQILLRNLLEVEGYSVLLASNGPEALAAALQHHPEAMLLDLMMPGMDGFEVCQRLRRDPSLATMPILMLTALDDRASRLQGLRAGADDFLSKPFDSAELRARLKTITQLKRYRRLSEQRARFEAVIQHAPEAIVLTERDGTILYHNAAFAALVDLDAAHLENFFDALPADVATALRTAVQQPATRLPARETRLPGGRRPDTQVEITFAPVPWEGGTIVQFHVRDLTERKALEAQLFRAQRIEVLGQLAGSVVHDMNNVLTAIGGSASLIEMLGRAEPIHLQNIQRSVQRGGNMMRQLLSFARGSDGAFEPVRLQVTAAEVADLVRETFGRNYAIAYAAPDDLPPVYADSTQVHQVLMNLCVNARDAMEEGGQILIAARRVLLDDAGAAAAGPDARAGEFVVISVRDSGTGIPSEIVPRLFDPFFTTKPKGKGTGLGLATVMRVMRRHQGFITLETEIGRGTCFHCHFPIPTTAPAPAN